MKFFTSDNFLGTRLFHISRDVYILSLQTLLTPFILVVSSDDTIWYVPEFDPCCSFEVSIYHICKDWLHESRVTLGSVEICLTEPTYRVICGTWWNRW